MHSTDAPDRRPGGGPWAAPVLALAALFLTYVALGWSGYGTDPDTYLMIRAGRDVLQHGHYAPSRPPGYLVAEILIAAESLLGGFYLSNFVSAVLGASTLVMFWRLLTLRFSRGDSILMTILVGVNPYFVVAASSSMDYVYSLFFGLLGLHLFKRDRPYLGAIALALAVSSRLSNVLILSVAYLYFVHQRYASRDFKGLRRLALSALLGIAATALLFTPSYIAYHHSLRFLTYAIGDWTFVGHLYRWGYKNLYLIGLFSFAVAAGFTIWKAIRGQIAMTALLNPAVAAGLVALVAHESSSSRSRLKSATCCPSS